MPGIMTKRRRKAGTSAIKFFAAHHGAIAAGLEKRLSRLLRPGEDPVDFRLAVKLLGRLVETSLDELVDFTDVDRSDDKPILELLEAARKVSSQVVTIRRIFGGLYGAQRAKKILGLEGPTARPEQPELLIDQGERLAVRLQAPELEPPRHTSVELDVAVMAAELETAVDRLAEAWEAALDERRTRRRMAGLVSDVGRDFDADHRHSLRLGVGLCLMARLPKLACRLRKSQIQPSRRRS